MPQHGNSWKLTVLYRGSSVHVLFVFSFGAGWLRPHWVLCVVRLAWSLAEAARASSSQHEVSFNKSCTRPGTGRFPNATLQGLCHEIFHLWFFHQRTSPLIRKTRLPIRVLLRINYSFGYVVPYRAQSLLSPFNVYQSVTSLFAYRKYMFWFY
jgi:hypothetical protein